jgi:hypothetical protein
MESPEVSTSTLRFFDAASLSPFLLDAGFSIEEQCGDWNRTPVTATEPGDHHHRAPVGRSSGFTIAQLHAMHASIAISKSAKALGIIVSCGNM